MHAQKHSGGKSDWAQSPGHLLLLSMAHDINRRRQQGIPSPQTHGDKNLCPLKQKVPGIDNARSLFCA